MPLLYNGINICDDCMFGNREYWETFSPFLGKFFPEDFPEIKAEKREQRIVLTSRGYEHLAVSFPETENPQIIRRQLYAFCANILLTKGILHLHSSFVLYHGQAILFTGPSGIGKTTQAELWRDYQGAKIVNGDAALLRKEGDRWWAYGTPIHGTSPYCENEQAPIRVLVVLEQGSRNQLSRLNGFSALSSCLPEFYRPRMDGKTEEIFWNTADELFREIPVWKLTCRPDKEATERLKNQFF